MRRLDGTDEAGRAARHGEPGEIEADEEILAMQAWKLTLSVLGRRWTESGVPAPLRRMPPSDFSSSKAVRSSGTGAGLGRVGVAMQPHRFRETGDGGAFSVPWRRLRRISSRCCGNGRPLISTTLSSHAREDLDDFR